ncbi:MAG: DUF4267 domain-containing protein [Candidatus Baltobacteraceae bacterium]
MSLGIVLSILAGAGFLLIGMAALARPAILSHLYGLYVHEKNGRGFVRATGTRDAAFGILLIAFAFISPHALLVTLLVGAALALCDFLIVWRSNGTFEPVLYSHLFGLGVLLAIATFVGMSIPSH